MSPNIYTIGACIIASSGALLFGLDVGVTGGVVAMPSFVEKFFPDTYESQQNHLSTNSYCSFDSQLLSLFTSSFFLAGMLSSLPASWITEKCGRKTSMCVGAIMYLLGSTLNVVAADTLMLIVGRLILGLGCGFANQAVPIFLAELPPPQSRGALQVCFQIFVNIGILLAGITNYYTSRVKYGWRISLGVFIPPALVLLIGSIFLPETPSFLYRSGNMTKARNTLQKLRGADANIEDEWSLIVKDVNESKKHGNPSQQLRTLLSRPYRGELTVACFIAIFSQLTGINSMLYYTPELFQSLGRDSGLAQAVAVAAVLLAGALTSLFVIDRVGRRPLLISGGILLFLLQVDTSLVLLFCFDPYASAGTSPTVSRDLLALICIFTFCFGWSWGPLGWLVPVESQSQATRSAASTMSVVTNFFAVFLTTQFFLPMLCALQWGTFLIFAAFDVAMVVFAWLLVVETKGIPVEDMRKEFQSHSYWKKYATELIGFSEKDSLLLSYGSVDQ
jgi:sugar porter (SP) family MFS transporter